MNSITDGRLAEPWVNRLSQVLGNRCRKVLIQQILEVFAASQSVSYMDVRIHLVLFQKPRE